MKEHKRRQHMFHALEEPGDEFNAMSFLRNYEADYELINEIVEYFTTASDIIRYPSKSYAVAIIYAKLLDQYFGEDFYESLNDPDLLHGNDVFFVPYNEAKHIYDAVLGEISLEFNTNLPQVNTTVSYFLEEFYLTDNPYFDNTDIV